MLPKCLSELMLVARTVRTWSGGSRDSTMNGSGKKENVLSASD